MQADYGSVAFTNVIRTTRGAWKYLHRTVDKQGKTVNFPLTAKRDTAAAKRFRCCPS